MEPGANGDRDLKLVDAALRSLRETYRIDDDRIYATGYSNGGMFTYLLWAERPGVFAAYAPVAARLRPSVRPTQAAPVFHVAGERDRVVRFEDQEAAIAAAVEVNGVDETASCGAGCTVYGAGTARAGHDLDPCRRPHLPARDHPADRLLLPPAFPHALTG